MKKMKDSYSVTMDVAYLLAVAAAIRPKTQETQRKMENVVNVVWIGPKNCSQFKGFFYNWYLWNKKLTSLFDW